MNSCPFATNNINPHIVAANKMITFHEESTIPFQDIS
jgi:hypothetical protein